MHYVVQLLVPFNRLVQFQEIVWFISQELRMEHTEHVDELIRRIDEGFGTTQHVISNNSKLRMIRSDARRNHMSIVLTTGLEDAIVPLFNKVLTGRHFYFVVIILVDKVRHMQPVYEFCKFLYEYQFLNALLYFESHDGVNQLWGASRYPVMEIENRTDIGSFFRKRASQLTGSSNVEGFAFPTPLRQDLPHLFKVAQRQEGSTYRIIETFVHHLNGSFSELALPPDALGGQVVNMQRALQLVRERRVEFLAHAYALFMPDEQLEKSYPLLVVRWCLMVPLYNSVSTLFYVLQPFHWIVWCFVLGAFVALSLLELFWLWLRGGASPADALLNSFCYTINIATGRQLLRPASLRFLLLLAVFFHGFFLSAQYTSNLGSILAVNLFHAQINTMDDILEAQLPVMIIDYELEFLLQLHEDLPPAFRQLLRPVDSGVFAQHQTGFNSSFAYFVTEDAWQFLDEQQRHLKQRQFKFSDICFGSFHLAYPMQMDSFLWRDLEYFSFRIHSSGLLNYYARISFDAALHAGLVQRLQENKDFTSAGMQHLAVGFMLLLVMFVLASVVLALEILHARLTRQIA
ncbi:uncharacterized protein LOC108595870 [Drosophila busckii]|nr:uncharacterized protein LOC108595870 [Drosophila busckii]